MFMSNFWGSVQKEVDTMQETRSKRVRRRHDAQLKDQVVAACRQPEASVAVAIAMAHGLNANMVHRWLREERQAPAARVPALARPAATPSFTALPMTGGAIH